MDNAYFMADQVQSLRMFCLHSLWCAGLRLDQGEGVQRENGLNGELSFRGMLSEIKYIPLVEFQRCHVGKPVRTGGFYHCRNVWS